ncbi:MAG: MBOAT family protein [Alphaproteobacteria bacterium]|jgi:D-alanyl-lipoteichoic acid acyltransferase DltB (MBOAT superfamily)|nr:MBOAT family protein [Alphaproteobacteria bacterium]
MLFPTLDFALFFVVVFAAAWALSTRPTGRKLLLVGASYFFYGYWDWRFCFLLLVSSLINYGAGRWLDALDDDRARRRVVGLAVAANLAILGFFKYFGFFIQSLNDLFFTLGLERELPFLSIILPVGISFFTFQGISYIVDVYRGDVRAQRSPLNVLLYISFFPQLVAGPIVRASTFMPQIEAPPDRNRILAGIGLILIVFGLFKKVVVANYLATEMVDLVFLDPFFYGPVDLTLAVWGYAIQIYCDFSAYSDIAIGVAALLGYRFQKNFDQPYRAQSLREFWRRWHISLSSFLRDYLYIPLGGSRPDAKGRDRTRRNLMITMVLGGVWHGAAWTFVFWGFLHGLGLAVERTLGLGRLGDDRPVWRRLLAVVIVFHFVCLTWIFFRSETFGIALTYLAGFANLGAPVEFFRPFILVLIVIGFAMHALPPDLPERLEARLRRVPLALQGALAGLAVALIDALGPEGVAPFIYFQF